MIKLRLVCLILIVSVHVYSNELQLNSLFTEPGYISGDVYFSSLNPEFSGEDRDDKLLFNAIKECAKFLTIDLAYHAAAYPLGSFYLNDRAIFIDYNTDMIGRIIPYVKPVLPEDTDHGTVSAIKISASSMQELWRQFSASSVPDYSDIIKKINESYPEWYFSMPDYKGVLFGLGVSDNMSTTAKKVEMADFYAMIDIINSLSIKVSNEYFSYADKYTSLHALFSNQKSKASIAGIKIIKRYYSKEYDAVFSLAVLRLR